MNVRTSCLVGVLGAWLMVSCARPPLMEPVHPALSGSSGKVVVLESQKIPFLNQAVVAFLQNTDVEVRILTQVGEADPGLVVEAVDAYHPDLVVTMGTPATLLARDRLGNYPVLFTLVLNQARLGLGNHANMTGIAMEIAPMVEFTQFKMVMPSLKHVAVFYTAAQSGVLLEQARHQLDGIGIELDAIEVSADDDALAIYEHQQHRPDALWILNDPIVFKQFPAILSRMSHDGIPVITSFHEQFARLGALASMSVDMQAVGSQAAAMARTLLNHRKSPAQLGIQQPIGTRLVVNADQVRRFKIDISTDVLPFINEMVSTEALSSLSNNTIR